jgi:RNA recognition motif-containing protein
VENTQILHKMSNQSYNNNKERINTKLYIGYIPIELGEDGLASLFVTVGKIKDIYVIKCKDDKNYTFGFVEYTTQVAAATAINTFNNYEINGRRLRVQYSERRNNDNDNNYYQNETISNNNKQMLNGDLNNDFNWDHIDNGIVIILRIESKF